MYIHKGGLTVVYFDRPSRFRRYAGVSFASIGRLQRAMTLKLNEFVVQRYDEYGVVGWIAKRRCPE